VTTRLRRGGSDRSAVVVFAGLDWWYHNQAHADFQLAMRLARTRRVLLVNSIGTRFPVPGRTTQIGARIRRKLRSVLRGVRRPRPDLPDFFVWSPLSVPVYGSRLGRRVNAVLLAAQLRLVCACLGIRRPATVLTPPTALPIARRLRPSRLVYNRSDKHSAWAEADQEYLAALEAELLATADAVLYVAQALMAEEAPVVGDRAVFLDHGVDLEAFGRPGPEPADLAAVPRPRIGYIGALRDHTVDLDLLERVAREVPEASVVLVGPSTMDLSPLEGLANVHVLGPRPHADVPAYGAALDVALMPWLDNDWIRACNPIKMKEYLALGLPTVTTDFPEARRYAGVLEIAADAEDFVARARRLALTSSVADAAAADRRRAALAGETWDARADELSAVLFPERVGRTPSGGAPRLR
jgi:glycosyltransferase involved in cell wall biosynthesis